MSKFSRREFLFLSAAMSLICPFPALASQNKRFKSESAYSITKSVLNNAFITEMIAHKHYVKYTEIALKEDYPNIAYLFHSFSYSEKIHADNYKRILKVLGHGVKDVSIRLTLSDTKTNVKVSAQKELDKIEKTYPDFLRTLKAEDYEEAIISCMYSWKSHRQHKDKVDQILKYSGIFFGAVMSKIEGLSLDFHVCKVCGSTIDEPPATPCVICNRSMANYFRVERPKKSV